MANLYFTVHESATQLGEGDVQQENVIAIGAISTQGAAITGTSPALKSVRLFAESKVFVTWGSNPTATNDGLSGRPVGAENPEWVQIKAGDLIAVIERT